MSSTFVVIIKIVLTLFLTASAVVSAAKSVEAASLGKRKTEPAAASFIIGVGLLSGLFAILLPVGWPVQLIFIVTYIVMQIINTEGKHRAACWSLLSLLSGAMMFMGVFAWQNDIHGLKAGMITFSVVMTLVPIVIGAIRSFRLERLNIENGKVTKKMTMLLVQHKKTAIAAVFLCITVAVLISAVAWAVS